MLKHLRELASKHRGLAIPVVLMRGGTSKGVFVMEEDIPKEDRDKILLRMMGSPDPTRRQLDGLGGGISSTSKVGIMSKRDGMAVYNFGQVSLDKNEVDWSGSCGNLAAAAGLFAIEQELYNAEDLERPKGSGDLVSVPVWQENSEQLLNLRVPFKNQEKHLASISGVPGLSPKVYVETIDPCKGKVPFLPSGNATDALKTLNGKEIEATLVVGANPTIFVRSSDFGLSDINVKHNFEKLKPEIDHLMRQGSKIMKKPVSAATRVCMISCPTRYTTTGGEALSENSHDIQSRISTEGRIHHAHTVTGALNLAMAAEIEGTLPHKTKKHGNSTSGHIRIGNPAGVMTVFAKVDGRKPLSAGLMRTARTLSCGLAFICN